MLLNPTSNVDLHNRPPNKTQKNHPPPPSPHVMSSSHLAALSPHAAPALFVCGCRIISLPLLVIPLRRHTTLLRCNVSLVIPLVLSSLSHRVIASLRHCVVVSLRCRVLSRLVIVWRSLTHLASTSPLAAQCQRQRPHCSSSAAAAFAQCRHYLQWPPNTPPQTPSRCRHVG